MLDAQASMVHAILGVRTFQCLGSADTEARTLAVAHRHVRSLRVVCIR